MFALNDAVQYEEHQSNLSLVELQNERDSLQYFMGSIERLLPYADHGAYGQDLDAIRGYREKIAIVDKLIKIKSEQNV